MGRLSAAIALAHIVHHDIKHDKKIQMNKLILFLFLSLHSAFLLGQQNTIEKARQKFNRYCAVSYNTTAYYPNPETEEIKSIKVFYIVNNYGSKNFDFYSKSGNSEEIYNNEIFAEIDSANKIIYQYQEKENQADRVLNSRLVQYGPAFLINHDWTYQNEVLINGINHSRYSFIQDTHRYENKSIKVEFNIYISPKHTISKFERKSSVDDKVGQVVTYDYFNYNFSKKRINFKSLPEGYNLKYFEKTTISPLQKGTQAPAFKAEDMDKNSLSEQDYLGNQTCLLFSSTNCGASKIVSDFLNDETFKLPTNVKFINVYASDSKENIEKYFKGRKVDFPIVVQQKELENKYQISGYPILYFIDSNGIILEVFEGSDQIIEFLKSANTKK